MEKYIYFCSFGDAKTSVFGFLFPCSMLQTNPGTKAIAPVQESEILVQ